MIKNKGASPNAVLLILAAGEGRRFGGIKQLADIQGKPLLRHVIEQTIDPAAYHTIVVLGAHAQEIRPVISDFDIDILRNDNWQSGLSSSIRTGVDYIESHLPDIEGLIVALGDQWQLRNTHLHQLLDVHVTSPESIIATAYGESCGVPAFFPKSHWPMLKTLTGDQGAGKVLHEMKDVMLVEIPEARMDVDSPDDLSEID